MEVKILVTGSKGNAIAIGSGGFYILVDAGIARTKIEKRLLEVGINPALDLKAIFLSHAHGDHIRGLVIANKYNIPVYASEGEWKDIDSVNDDLRRRLLKAYRGYSKVEVESISVTPFGVHHDAYEPLGYVIEDGTTKCCVVFDTGKVDTDMLAAMADSDIYIIESNHDPILVENSNYPDSVKARILSDIGHLSNQQTATALKQLVRGKGERIILTHLSSSNNTPMHARVEVMKALLEKGFRAGQHYELEVVSE